MMSLGSKNAPSLDVPARFMVLGIVALLLAVLISPWTLPLMQEQFNAFSLLAMVHLMTLGFIGAMIIGASYQLVPVAIGALGSAVPARAGPPETGGTACAGGTTGGSAGPG